MEKEKMKLHFNKESIYIFFVSIFLCVTITVVVGTLLALFIWNIILHSQMSMMARLIYFSCFFIYTMICNFLLCFLRDEDKN